MKFKKTHLLISLLTLSFILISILITFKESIFIDNYIFDFMQSIQSKPVTYIMEGISFLFEPIPFLLLALSCLLIFRKKRDYIYLLTLSVIVPTLNYLLKLLFTRERPTSLESSYSFPSGHAMISLAFYGFILHLINKYTNNKYIKFSNILFISLIILTGFSRLYLSMHYFTDVIAGFIISSLVLILFISNHNKKSGI